MAGKDKNIRTTLSGFLRYRGKEMSNSERNAFERELEKDPFAGEAAEGFSELTPEEIRNDLDTLQKKLNLKTSERNRMVYYRIAASIAVLMVISSIFFVFQRNKTENQVSENVKNEIPIEISKAPALSELKSEQNKHIALNQVQDSIKKGEEPGKRIAAVVFDDLADKSMEVTAAGKKAEGIISIPEKKEAENLIIATGQPKALARVSYAIIDAAGPTIVKGKVISSGNNLPIPGVNVNVKGTTIGTQTDTGGNFAISLPDSASRLFVANFIGMESKEFTAKSDSFVQVSLNPSNLALNEVVVVGYGTKRKSEKDMTGAVSTIQVQNVNESSTYTPPQPVNGKESFDKYIEENIRRPAYTKAGQREVVVVSFTIKSTGIIDSIRIIRSPGELFSDEVIRLIKSGPSWKPAEKNGKITEDEVRVRIVFR
jgi:hypothetical protein